jgi:hypothetical protein
MKLKSPPLNKVKLLKELGRQRVGPPKPTKVLKSKKRSRLNKAIVKDMLEDLT